MSATLRIWFVIALALSAGLAHAADKVALLSTSFVLERKFKLMEEAARLQGVELAWTQVDRAEPAGGEAGVRRALQGARLVILDTPRSDDQAQIERVAGKLLREAGLPTVGVQVMSPPQRLRALQMDAAQAQRLFDYYVGGTRANHERLASTSRPGSPAVTWRRCRHPSNCPMAASTTRATSKRCLPRCRNTWPGGNASRPGLAGPARGGDGDQQQLPQRWPGPHAGRDRGSAGEIGRRAHRLLPIIARPACPRRRDAAAPPGAAASGGRPAWTRRAEPAAAEAGPGFPNPRPRAAWPSTNR
jgi:hypothetical protein